MEPIQTLYNLLGINLKIPDENVRLLYLKDVWGLEQTVIGELEDKSQSYISKTLVSARKSIPQQVFDIQTENLFSAAEIEYLQFLPRSIVMDLPILSFIKDVLQVEPIHPFFIFYDDAVNVRIAALSSLGIQHKCLQKLFGKSQPTISMIVKRNRNKAITFERANRYEKQSDYKLKPKKYVSPYLMSGGSM